MTGKNACGWVRGPNGTEIVPRKFIPEKLLSEGVTNGNMSFWEEDLQEQYTHPQLNDYYE